MKKITQYEGLYGQRGIEHSREYLFSELLETRSELFDWKIKPHVHPDLYQLFFIIDGEFELDSSAGRATYNGPCLVFIPPGAVHGFSYQAGSTGRILTWSESLMSSLFPDDSPVLTRLSAIRIATNFPFPFTSAKIAEQITSLHEELFTDLPEKQNMLKARLQELTISVYRLCIGLDITETVVANPAYIHYRKLQELLRKASAQDTVKDLSGTIGITPIHLNRVCNQIAGKSAGKLLEESLLDSAKNYLVHTSYSVSEIAYLLGFGYPNYFARFFRKHTGMSPRVFRLKQ